MPRYQFGPFLLDSERRILRRNDERLAISGKPFETLLTLIESAGRVVLKEELLDRVWAGVRTEEGSLTQSVFTVRKLLGENAKDPQYIATIAGRGYQFVSPVSKIDSHQTTKKTLSFRRPIAWQPVLAMVLAGMAVSIYYLMSSSNLPLVTDYVQMTHDGTKKSLIGLGGNSLFFERGPDTVRLRLPEGVEQTITVSGQGTLNVSPDGEALLWQTPYSAPLVESQMWRVPVAEQSPQMLPYIQGHAGAWSPDGKRLIYAHGIKLYLADNNGNQAKQIALLSGVAGHFSWSPNNRLVRFDLLDTTSVSRTLWQIDTNDNKQRSLLEPRMGFADACCGHWTSDGAYFVFESGGQVWAIDEKRSKGKPVQLTFSPMRLSTPIPGSKAEQLFAIGKVLRGELLQYDASGKRLVRFLNGLSAEFVDVSADQQWIVYVTFPEGVLWRSKLDGTERRALSALPLHAFAPKWSRDGKRVIFSDRGMGRPSKLYVVEADGKGLHPLLADDNEAQVDGNWTPDGRKIVFGNDFTATDPSIHILDLNTNKLENLPGSLGLFSPRLSPSGRYLLASPVDSRRLMVYDFQINRWTQLVKGNFSSLSWSPDGCYVYAVGSYHGKNAIIRIRQEDQRIEPLVYENGFASTGSMGFWFGLGPNGSILGLHDTGIEDIYSLVWPRR